MSAFAQSPICFQRAGQLSLRRAVELRHGPPTNGLFQRRLSSQRRRVDKAKLNSPRRHLGRAAKRAKRSCRLGRQATLKHSKVFPQLGDLHGTATMAITPTPEGLRRYAATEGYYRIDDSVRLLHEPELVPHAVEVVARLAPADAAVSHAKRRGSLSA
jgi:hypothetical protein